MSCSIEAPKIVLLLGLMAAAAALGCQHNLVRRERTDWQSEAKVTNPNDECSPYSYAPIQSIIKSYPAIWEVANLSQPGIDPAAIALFHQIAPKIPKIKPKGTPTGDNSAAISSYSPSDPDCWWTLWKCTTPKLPGLPPDISTCPEPNTWGLTIDDGPNCSHNAYYDYLRQSDQKATLFYIGSNVIDWPLEAQRGLADGHEICAHTWSHSHMTSLSDEQAFAEMYFSKKIIKDVLGVTVQCWRPPFGDVDDRVRFIASALGVSTILWDHDLNDFRYITLGQAAVEANYQNLIDAASKGAFSTKGAIVLTHELNADTMETNQKFLPKIQQAFKYITPVAVCQNNTQPYVELNYTYPSFAQWTTGTRVGTLPPPSAARNGPLTITNVTSTNTPPYAPSKATPPTGSASPSASVTPASRNTSSPTSDVASNRGYNLVLLALIFSSMVVIL